MTGEGYVLTTGLATGLPEDLVAEVAGVLDWYGCDQGHLTGDAAAKAILAARAHYERKAAEDRAHARHRDDPLRLAETRTILDLAEGRRRAKGYTAGETFAGTGEIQGTHS